jgi:diguanylate cyclase (GGDEF)-like protein
MPDPVHALLVEDSENDALLVAHQLSRHEGGVEIVRVETSQALDEQLRTRSWDIVISDYQMPEFSGLAALNQVKAFDAGLPVILISATIAEKTAIEAMRAGASDYVMKGNLARLLPALQRELAVSQARRQHELRDRAQREQIEYLATHDFATGLGNRRLFLERLSDAPRPHGAVIVVELQRLAAVNEALGHGARDAVQRQAAGRLARAWGEERVARVAAGRFALTLPHVATEADAVAIIEGELDALMRKPFQAEGAELRIEAAAGIALPREGASAEASLRNAEAAATRAAAVGERYLVYAEQIATSSAQRLAMESRLRRALDNGELLLHYQPKVAAEDGRIVAMEALLRWQDPEHGLVYPAQFIPVLEDTGMILEAGAWALRQAVRDRARWSAAGLEAPRVAVNVSVRQLRRRDFVATVVAALAEAPGPAGLDLEITESTLMEDLDGAVDKLSALRQLGVRISIDDFGTGHSSLAYLMKLPVDAIKVDRSFVHGMLEQPAMMTLVKTIVELAHSLRLSVIAEGVETEDEARALRALGCDELQGYLYARPMAFEAMAARLARNTG